MLDAVRVFIGCRIGPPLSDFLNEAKLDLKRRSATVPARWVHDNAYALIFFAMGEVEPYRMLDIERAIQPVCRQFPPLQLSLGGWIGLPSTVSLRQVGVSIAGDVGRLTGLQEGLRVACVPFMHVTERPVPPHIPLAMLRSESPEAKTTMGLALRHVKREFGQPFTLSAVEVLRTAADENMAAQYEALKTVSLG